MRSSIVIGIFTLFVTIATQAVLANHRTRVISHEEVVRSEQFVIGLAKNFSSFYDDNFRQFGNRNQVISPLSVFIPMSMLSYGAQEETKKEILAVIGLRKSEAQMAQVGFKKYLNKLAKYGVRTHRRMMVSSGVRMNSFYIDFATDVFSLEIEAVDNSNKQPMDSTFINEWVATKTNGTVTKFLELENIGRGPSFALVGTVYFKGTWKKAFDKSQTALMRFHSFRGDRMDVPTMHTSGLFSHGWIEEIAARFVELPYETNSEGDCMSMFIFLPDDSTIGGLLKLIANLRQLDLNRLSNSTEEKIQIFLPKFKIETEISLNNFFRSISAFNEPANFSGIFKSSKRSHLKKSTSKVTIEVDEEGQEALELSNMSFKARKTAPALRQIRSSRESEITTFRANHPFVAMTVIKGETFSEIFLMNFLGSEFTQAEDNKI